METSRSRRSLDSKKRQVATWRGQVHPDYFAEVLYALGTYYNEAFICVENNSHGILTCTRLGKDMAYPNFYTEVQHDKITDRETVKLGFSTTAKTKPLIIDQLRAAMRENEIELNDKTTIREMLTYIVTESGAMEAEASCFDDCVIQFGTRKLRPRRGMGTSRSPRRTLFRNGVKAWQPKTTSVSRRVRS